VSDVAIRLTNVRKSFGATPIILGVSLDIRRGERHAIIGPNGAGKTTLIHQISGALAPDAGRIHFDGRDVTAALGGPWTGGDVVEMDITSVFRVEPGFWHTIALLLSGQGRLVSMLRLAYTV